MTGTSSEPRDGGPDDGTSFGLLGVLGPVVAGPAVVAMLDRVLRAGRIGVWSWEPTTGSLEWSGPQAWLHDLPRREFTGTVAAHLDLVHPEDRPLVEGALYTLDGADGAVVYRTASRPTRWLESRWETAELRGNGPGHVGVTVDVTDSRRREHRAARESRILAGLHEATASLLQSSGLVETIRSVTESTADLLGADGHVAVLEVENADAEPECVALGDAADAADAVDAARAAFAGSQLAVDRAAAPLHRRRSCRSAVAVPLRRQGRVVGALAFLADRAAAFDAEDHRLVAAIGAQTSLALPAATEYERQEQAARTLQAQLLPPARIDLPGLDVCVRYSPATEGLAIGGDWYDAFHCDGRVVAIVGDTCGHGVEAAAHMGELRYSLRALVRGGLAVPVVFQQLNELCARELGTTATVVLAEIWSDTGDCNVWSAGHLPAVIGSDGAHRFVDDDATRAPLLGVADRIEPGPTVEHLEPGDSLLLYTDGLVERRRESIDDGLARLAEAVSTPGRDLDDFCDGLLESLTDGRDDVALVGIRRR